MRKLLVTCLIALLAGTLSAQTAPRTSGTSQRGGTPSTQTKSRIPQNTDARTSRTTASPRTDAAGNSSTSRTSSPSATQNRSTLQPQNNTGNSRTLNVRPSATTPSGNTMTSRSVAGSTAKKAPEVKAAVVNPVTVKWMTLEEALEKNKTDKRKIFVDVYTDWCGWCKRMDSTTFMNPAVARYLNDHYYPVKFNAEQQKDIVFKDKTYQFKKNGARGHHELAAEWLNNRLSYPTAVFLDENQSVIQPLPGYQDAAKMEAVLNYFGTDSHKKTPWESYQKNFTPAQR